MSEPTLRCPGCGAPAAADAASCRYCGSALATVTCPSCFAPMFIGSRFCASCGAEATRVAVAEEAPLSCPRCHQPMQALRLGATSTRECAACGGLWLDPPSLQQLADAREERAAVVSTLAARIVVSTAHGDDVRYIPCPSCARLMNRMNFAHSSGVILDVCKAHGVWLDRGELQRVLQFIEAGGLTVARDRQLEQLAEDQRRITALAAGGQQSDSSGASAFAHPSSRRDDGDANPAGLLGHLLFDALGSLH